MAMVRTGLAEPPRRLAIDAPGDQPLAGELARLVVARLEVLASDGIELTPALVRRAIEGYGEEVMRGWKLSWDRRQQLKGMLAVYLV